MRSPVRPRAALAACLRFGFMLVLSASGALAATLVRDADPVVLTGAQTADLIGVPPGRIVAFRYVTGWHQVPVQVDERDLRDLAAIYNNTPAGFSTLVFTDPWTFTGHCPCRWSLTCSPPTAHSGRAGA